MEPASDVLVLRAVPHPVATVHQAGFPIDHPYLERCWTSVIGPSSVLLLRRAALLLREAPEPAVSMADLATTLGIGGQRSIHRTLERVVGYRFAMWAAPGELDVFTTIPPIGNRHLDRGPASLRRDHERLLADHLDGLAGAAPRPFESRVTGFADRLHRVQTRAAGALAADGIGR